MRRGLHSGARKGFCRLGNMIDGHAEAVRVGRLPAPHARANAAGEHEVFGGKQVAIITVIAALCGRK